MGNQIDTYISKKSEWEKELNQLRSILLELPLEETIKWGSPTYVYKGKNLVGMSAFKSYCGLWFFQGALIEDTNKVFINAQGGKTKAMLQWRFDKNDEIDKVKIQDYVRQAMHNIDIGNEIKPERKTKKVIIPEMLANAFQSDASLKSKFEEFSPSKQREFTEYIQDAKREATKESRLQKILPMIKNGVGLNDKYRKC